MRNTSEISDSVKIVLASSGVIILFTLGLFVAPSVVLPTTEQQDFNSISSTPIIVDNTVTFDSDTHAVTKERLNIERDGRTQKLKYVKKIKYDSDTERVLILDSPDIRQDETNYANGRYIIQQHYYEQNEAGEFKYYRHFRIYDTRSDSWETVEKSNEAECRLNDTTLVEKSGDTSARRLPNSDGFMLYEFGSTFMEIETNKTGTTYTRSIKEGAYIPKQSSGGFLHITESAGRSVAEKQTGPSGDVYYETRDANVTAKGTVYNGFLNFPITKFWQGGKSFEVEHSVSVNQSSEVTVERPEWVSTYEQECS